MVTRPLGATVAVSASKELKSRLIGCPEGIYRRALRVVRRLDRVQRIAQGTDRGVERIACCAKRSKRFVMTIENRVYFRPDIISHGIGSLRAYRTPFGQIASKTTFCGLAPFSRAK